MMKKIVIVLTVIIVCIIGYNYIIVIRYGKGVDRMQEKLLSLGSSYHAVKQNLFKVGMNTKVKLSLKENEKLKKILQPLKDLSKPLIVFRFYNTSCNPCIERELSNLVKFKADLPDIDIIVIANIDKKKIKSKIRNAGLEAKIVVLKDNENFLPFEEDYDLYICTIDKDFDVTNLFFPIQHDNNFSISYYSCIKNTIICK